MLSYELGYGFGFGLEDLMEWDLGLFGDDCCGLLGFDFFVMWLLFMCRFFIFKFFWIFFLIILRCR